MKKFLIILVLLFLINPVFAKVTQCVKKYQLHQFLQDKVLLLIQRNI